MTYYPRKILILEIKMINLYFRKRFSIFLSQLIMHSYETDIYPKHTTRNFLKQDLGLIAQYFLDQELNQ